MSREIVLTTQTKGTFTSKVDGYKLVEKGTLKEYILVGIPENATFKVVNFNTANNRVLLFLHRRGMTSEVVEVGYKDILDNTLINNEMVNQSVDSLLISDRVKYILSKESIKTILIYVALTLSAFLAGRV